MKDKEPKSILCADVDFQTHIRDAFKKPLRQNVQPIVVGSVIEMEPAYNSKRAQVQYGLVLSADQKTQEIQTAPIDECHVCSSKGNEFNCFVSHHDDLTAMGKDKAVSINILATQTLKMAPEQITNGDDYLLLTQDQNYPLIRAVGKAPEHVLKEAQETYRDYLLTLQHRESRKPHISDDIKPHSFRSPSAMLMEWGVPDTELH